MSGVREKRLAKLERKRRPAKKPPALPLLKISWPRPGETVEQARKRLGITHL
jgi:hypothetical protein